MNRIEAGQDELVFLPLGGSGEIGMNFNAYGYRPPSMTGKWIIVDCGVMFGRETRTPGVDIIMPDIRYLAEQRDNILGIVATHAHEDHIGAIAPLWPMLKCPVYATPFTARIVAGKLEEAGLGNKVKLREVQVGGTLTLGPFTLDFISITHSILEPNLLAIRTPLGVVAHTGDWKLDPDPLLGEKTDEAAIAKLGDEGVLAMVCDSPMPINPGSSGLGKGVRDNLISLVGTLKGRVAVAAFASNVARLDSAARAAEANGRRLSPGGPLDAQDGRCGARDQVPARPAAHRQRGRRRRAAAAQGALPGHRQPGRAARRPGAHRRGQSSRRGDGSGRRGDFSSPHHSGQRAGYFRAAKQAGGAGDRDPDRRGP